MSPVSVRFPEAASIDTAAFAQACAGLADQRTRPPFDPELIDFCAGFSQRLLKNPAVAKHPQLASLGFFLRRAAVQHLADTHAGDINREGRIAVPRGLALHFPPANVDTLFMYSWAVSLLAGNANVVRLPADLNAVAILLLDILAAAATPAVRRSNLFVSYDRDDVVTAAASAACDVRVVWGGDEKVSRLRMIPLPPNAIDLNFANRFSMAAIALPVFAGLDDARVQRLALQFYNDVFWFDQMGCASPRVLYWCGAANDLEPARERFYRAVLDVARRKTRPGDTGLAVAKLNFAYRAMLDHDVARYRYHGDELTTLELSGPEDVRADIQGGGLLWDVRLDRLADLAPFVRRSDQTLSHFGFSSEELTGLARRLNGRGIDRMVPMGQALNFSHAWDGYDLITAFTRYVQIC